MSEFFGPGYARMFRQDHLTLGLNFPIEAYPNNPVPGMTDQIALAQKAEEAGFAALWTRDVPLLDPSFGDAGQIYDPWAWLGYVAAKTADIALATGAIILPLRRPVDLAKSATSIDQLSNGRLVMGTASGDRPVEYVFTRCPTKRAEKHSPKPSNLSGRPPKPHRIGTCKRPGCRVSYILFPRRRRGASRCW